MNLPKSVKNGSLRRGGHRVMKTSAIAAVSVFAAGFFLVFSDIQSARGKANTPLIPQSTFIRNNDGLADLIEVVKPAVVNISVSGTNNKPWMRHDPHLEFPPGSPFNDFFQHYFGPRNGPGDSRRPQFSAVGSGFLISDDGYVVTNKHVINQADHITVTLDSGKQYQAQIKGSDPKTDIALLKIDQDGPFPYVAFGDSDQARIGDQIIAIGNPFGLGNTATTGIISARGRDIHSGPFDNFIQIDAPINQGNSGGPLFDRDGRVIGINTAIYSPNGGNVGIGFAIPAQQAAKIVEQLRSTGHVQRGWLGIHIQSLNPDLASSLDLETTDGSLIADVRPSSPAKRSGLNVGDVILTFDGQQIRTAKDLTRIVASAKPDQEYSLQIWRNGKIQTLNVTPGTSPESRLRARSGQNSVASADPDRALPWLR